MNKEQRDKIRNRCDYATPGPWNTFPNEHAFHENGRDKDGQISAQIMMDEWQAAMAECEISWDAIFIAHARQDVPELLKYIEELTAERDKYKARAEAMERAMKDSCEYCLYIECLPSRSEPCASCFSDDSKWKINESRFAAHETAENEQQTDLINKNE